jgi:hypothetical protein
VDNAIVQKNAFVFCRYSIAVLVWLALVLRSVPLLALAFVILAASALLTVRRAPMIVLWTSTLGRLFPSEEEILDVRAMRVAHTAGAVLAGVSLALTYLQRPGAWLFVLAFAVLKTLSALGFCPAYKLYGCAMRGGCCALTAKR